MQPVLQSLLPRLSKDKFLHGFQFGFAACFESAGVMENIAVVTREDEFVIDIMLATLQAISFTSYDQP